MGGEFRGESVHVYVWLSPFTVRLKRSQRCESAQYKIKNVKKKKKEKKEGPLWTSKRSSNCGISALKSHRRYFRAALPVLCPKRGWRGDHLAAEFQGGPVARKPSPAVPQNDRPARHGSQSDAFIVRMCTITTPIISFFSIELSLFIFPLNHCPLLIFSI